jgi:hypothetical protein
MSTTAKALEFLPKPLQTLAEAHVRQFPVDDLGELASELFVSLTEAKSSDTIPEMFARARSKIRRFESGRIVPGMLIDYDDNDIDTPRKRREYVAMTQERLGVSQRRAQQLVAAAIKRLKDGDQGDLFAGGMV